MRRSRTEIFGGARIKLSIEALSRLSRMYRLFHLLARPPDGDAGRWVFSVGCLGCRNEMGLLREGE